MSTENKNIVNKFNGTLTLPDGTIFVMNFNTLAKFESMTNKNAIEFLAMIDSGMVSKIDDIITLLYCAALKHQPNITKEEIGELWSDNTGLMADLQASALPDVSEIADDNKKK